MLVLPPSASGAVRRARRAAIIAGIGLAWLPHIARSQLYPGDTVRLSIANLEVRRGAFVRADSGAVWLRVPGEAVPVATAYGDYTRAEVLLGRRIGGSDAVMRGGVIGMSAGAALGLARATGSGRSSLSNSLATAAVGALLGGAVGIGAGSAVSGVPREVWTPVDIRQLASTPSLAASPPAATAAIRGDTVVSTLSVRRTARPWGTVSAGDTVRLFAGAQPLVHGILAAADSDALLVVPDDMTDAVRYRRARITVAEVQRGERRRGAKPLATGALLGVGVGSLIFALGASDHSARSDGMGAAIGLAFGSVAALAGTLVGGIVSLTYTERWIRFDPATMWMMPDGG